MYAYVNMFHTFNLVNGTNSIVIVFHYKFHLLYWVMDNYTHSVVFANDGISIAD